SRLRVFYFCLSLTDSKGDTGERESHIRTHTPNTAENHPLNITRMRFSKHARQKNTAKNHLIQLPPLRKHPSYNTLLYGGLKFSSGTGLNLARRDRRARFLRIV